jgi:tetratricopeptide (TPR) repeat protein
LFAIFVFISLLGANEEFVNENEYNVIKIDLNKDKVQDQLLSSKFLNGFNLLFFIKENENLNLKLKTINFGEDGVFRVVGIYNDNLEVNEIFKINTQSYNTTGDYKYNYHISYINNNWYLTKIIAKYNEWNPEKSQEVEYTCIKKQTVLLEKSFVEVFDFQHSKYCKSKIIQNNGLDSFVFLVKKETFNLLNPKLNWLDIQRLKFLFDDFPLTTKSLPPYNNIAYYLQKAGSNKEAIYLLEKILKKYPKRTVAHYNLADAYWELGEKKKAIVSYTTYIEQMCNAGKEKRIPQVVRDRVSSK